LFCAESVINWFSCRCCFSTVVVYSVCEQNCCKVRFCIGSEGNSPNLRLVPQMSHQMKHCLTYSRSIGVWMQKGPFCGLQNMPKCISDRIVTSSLFGEKVNSSQRLLSGLGYYIAHIFDTLSSNLRSMCIS